MNISKNSITLKEKDKLKFSNINLMKKSSIKKFDKFDKDKNKISTRQKIINNIKNSQEKENNKLISNSKAKEKEKEKIIIK